MLIKENCIIDNMPSDVYHSDPTEVLEGFVQSASLSSSVAKALVEKTELEAMLDSRRLNPDWVENEGSDSVDLGTIGHDFVLRQGNASKIYEIAQVDAWRTNEAKTIRKHIEGRGLIALNLTTAPRVVDKVKDMYEALQWQMSVHKEYPNLMAKGKGEQSAFVKDGPIWLRARIDWMDDLYPDVLVDYKTTGISFDSWEKNQLWGPDGANYMQEAHYKRVGEILFERPMTFIFVVQQTFEPYLTKIIKIDESFRDEVTERYGLAKRRFVNGLKTGTWRGVSPYTTHSCPPPWILNKFETDVGEIRE